MATLTLRRFTNIATLKSIAPQRLLRFLQPHHDFFARRGVELHNGNDIDYLGILRSLMEPDDHTPRELLDALFLIEELSSSRGMDAILEHAHAHQLFCDPLTNDSAADLAVHAWLKDSKLLSLIHSEVFALRRRSFESYQTDRVPLAPFEVDDVHARTLEHEIDEWFHARRRGRSSRIYSFHRDDAWWFMIRHGDSMRREERLEDDIAILYRPVRYDVLVYIPPLGELRINAKSPHDRQFYRGLFGKILFDNANHFPGSSKYTLEPLHTQGPACLACADVEGMEWVRLRSIQIYMGGEHNEVNSIYASDVFEALAGRHIPGRIQSAMFQIKFEDSRTPRSVTIKPSNLALYTRDSDAALVETWLTKRGFITNLVKHGSLACA